jgi:hypothetical protein
MRWIAAAAALVVSAAGICLAIMLIPAVSEFCGVLTLLAVLSII